MGFIILAKRGGKVAIEQEGNGSQVTGIFAWPHLVGSVEGRHRFPRPPMKQVGSCCIQEFDPLRFDREEQ
jgi:hypothetical protein